MNVDVNKRSKHRPQLPLLMCTNYFQLAQFFSAVSTFSSIFINFETIDFIKYPKHTSFVRQNKSHHRTCASIKFPVFHVLHCIFNIQKSFMLSLPYLVCTSHVELWSLLHLFSNEHYRSTADILSCGPSTSSTCISKQKLFHLHFTFRGNDIG